MSGKGPDKQRLSLQGPWRHEDGSCGLSGQPPRSWKAYTRARLRQGPRRAAQSGLQTLVPRPAVSRTLPASCSQAQPLHPSSSALCDPEGFLKMLEPSILNKQALGHRWSTEPVTLRSACVRQVLGIWRRQGSTTPGPVPYSC